MREMDLKPGRKWGVEGLGVNERIAGFLVSTYSPTFR
jgi:hypothetical protein